MHLLEREASQRLSNSQLQVDDAQQHQPPRSTRKKFDPLTSQHSIIQNVPKAIASTHALNPYRRLSSRNRDRDSFEHVHRAVLTRQPRAFFRSVGPSEAYVNAAWKASDMNVWASASFRGESTTSLLNTTLSTRPASEVYDVGIAKPTLDMTFRLATSPHLRLRHRTAQSQRVRFEVDDHEFGTLQRPRTTAAADAVAATKRTSRLQKTLSDARDTRQKLSLFERSNHQKVNFSDFTKEELIQLIQAEGLPVPGEMNWDSAKDAFVHAVKKQVLVNFVKTSFFAAEPKPLVRVGKRLKVRQEYCIVDIFEGGTEGAVRVRAYDDRNCGEYQCTIIPNKMRELDLPKPPANREKADWLAWSKLLVPRLELTDENELRVGEPPRQANGLPRGFTLGESVQQRHRDFPDAADADDQEQATRSQLTTTGGGGVDGGRSGGGGGGGASRPKKAHLPPADPRHVTLFFRSL